MERELNRRIFLRRTIAASTGGTLALSLEEQALLAQMQRNATAAKPTVTKADAKAESPAGSRRGMPGGRIGNVTVSRLILGGNLIGGAAHSRSSHSAHPGRETVAW